MNFGDDQNATKLSDSLSDWAENAEKSATSFLNHFIRISPKHGADRKELLAPNQDIYLRENIRLCLQLAIMAVPRQQNELYKQSLEAVASWIRSYFDTNAVAFEGEGLELTSGRRGDGGTGHGGHRPFQSSDVPQPHRNETPRLIQAENDRAAVGQVRERAEGVPQRRRPTRSRFHLDSGGVPPAFPQFPNHRFQSRIVPSHT